MTAAPLGILAATLLEDEDLRRPRLVDDLAGNLAPATSGLPKVTPSSPPTMSTSPKAICVAGGAVEFSTWRTSAAATLYCLPPVLITANIDFASN